MKKRFKLMEGNNMDCFQKYREFHQPSKGCKKPKE